jgi:hypothetical protein
VELARTGATRERRRIDPKRGNGKRESRKLAKKQNANTKGKWEGFPKAGSQRFRENGAMFVQEAFQVGVPEGPKTGSCQCTHATIQATKVAQIKTEGTKGLLTVSSVRVRVWWKCEGLQMSCKTCG